MIWAIIPLAKAQQWEMVESPGLMSEKIDFISDDKGFAIMQIIFCPSADGSSTNNNRCGSYGLFKTEDRGNSWDTINTPIGIQSFMPINQIDFISEDIGYIELYDFNDNYPKLYKTEDGGISWTDVSPDTLYGWGSSTGFGTMLSFVNESDGYWAKGENLYKTNDGGISWNSIKGQDIINNFSNNSKTLEQVSFYDENNGLAIINVSLPASPWTEAHVCVTSDGGQTWKANKLDATYAGKAIQASTNTAFFITPWGVNDSVIYSTTNSGLSWDPLTMPDEIKNISSFDFRNDNEGYVYTSDQVFYKTVDGGINWTFVDSGNTYVKNITLTPGSGYTTGGFNAFMRLDELTSVSQIHKASDQFNLFPNPVSKSEAFNVIFENMADRNIAIYDITGKTVMNRSATALSERIELPSTINSGLYFVQVDNGIITKTKQIVVY